MTAPVTGPAEPDEPRTHAAPRSRRGRRLTGALLATAAAGGLVAGGFSIASAASPSPAPTSPAGTGAAGSSPSPSATSPGRAGREGAPGARGTGHRGFDRGGLGPGARFGGSVGVVTAVGSGSLTVRPDVGAAVTYRTTSDTKVREGRTAAELSAVRVGERVAVLAVRATGSGSGSGASATPAPSGGTSGSSGTSGASGTAARTARLVEIVQPHIEGRVTAVGSDTLTIRDRDGFTRTLDTSASTTYRRDGAAATRAAVTTGVWVAATGSVDSNGTSLDASTVAVRTTAAGRGPGGDLGPGLRLGPGHAGRRGGGPGAPSTGPSASPSPSGSAVGSST